MWVQYISMKRNKARLRMKDLDTGVTITKRTGNLSDLKTTMRHMRKMYDTRHLFHIVDSSGKRHV